MQIIILITTIVASVAAAPVYYFAHEPEVYHELPLSSKSTYTSSSQVIDHGSTFVHSPIVHASVPIAHTKTTVTKANQIVNHGGSTVFHPVHAYEVMPVHEVYHVPSKTTVTKSNQIVNHGGTTVVHHAPVVHTPVVHTPVVHSPVIYHSSPLVTLKTGDSAVTHQSSTVHETVPVVKSLNYVTVHH